MIISDTHRFIFLHNPKCAGTTVRRALSKYDTRNDKFWHFKTIPGPFPERDTKIDLAHLSLALVKTYYPDEFRLFEQYLVFGFVRSPIDRLLSAYIEYNKNNIDFFDESDQAFSRNVRNLAKYIHKRASTSVTDFTTRHAIEQREIYYNGDKNLADVLIRLECPAPGLKKISLFDPDLAKTIEKALSEKNSNASKYSRKGEMWNALPTSSKDLAIEYYSRDAVLFEYEL